MVCGWYLIVPRWYLIVPRWYLIMLGISMASIWHQRDIGIKVASKRHQSDFFMNNTVTTRKQPLIWIQKCTTSVYLSLLHLGLSYRVSYSRYKVPKCTYYGARSFMYVWYVLYEAIMHVQWYSKAMDNYQRCQ